MLHRCDGDDTPPDMKLSEEMKYGTGKHGRQDESAI